MGWLSKTFYGVDLDEEAARQADLDRKLALENERDLRAGVLTETMFDDYEANRRANYISDPSAEVRNDFNTELSNRAANLRDFAGDAVSTAVSIPFKVIPPIVWVIGLAFLAWRLGLLDGILSKTRRG